MPDFRPCSTCQSHSQAPLCQYTLWVISIHPEGTFGRLRYLFGRRPPQSNYPPGTVLVLAHQLESKINKSGISTMTPPRLTPQFPSLPPILHMMNPNPIPSCSKAPRGLFCPVAGNRHLYRYFNFAESLVETVPKSLHHSCGSELT